MMAREYIYIVHAVGEVFQTNYLYFKNISDTPACTYVRACPADVQVTATHACSPVLYAHSSNRPQKALLNVTS